MTYCSLMYRLVCFATACQASAALAQVHYHDNNSPWGQRADAEVPGWFYNLGITGLRAQLVGVQ